MEREHWQAGENVPQTATLVTRAPTVFLSLDQLYFWALLQHAPEFRELPARSPSAHTMSSWRAGSGRSSS
jgi:hypothetical protein